MDYRLGDILGASGRTGDFTQPRARLKKLSFSGLGHDPRGQDDVERAGREVGQRLDGQIPVAHLQHRPSGEADDAGHARLQGHARTVSEMEKRTTVRVA